MAVQTNQAQIVVLFYEVGSFQRRTGREGKAELLIFMRSSNELVGVRFHTGLHANEHVLHHACFSRHLGQATQLRTGVKHNLAHASGDSITQLSGGLVVAVEGHVLGWETRRQSDSHLVARGDIEMQPLLHYPAGDGLRQESLGCVVDILRAAEGLGHRAAARAEVLLIDDKNRSAKLLGNVDQAHATNFHRAGILFVSAPTTGGSWPDMRW